MKNKILALLVSLALVSYGLTYHYLSFIPSDKTLVLTVDHRMSELNRFMSKHKCSNKYNKDYLNAADKYNLDYRILPVISIKESTCLRQYPIDSNNPFGWGSGRIGFASIPIAIDYIAGQLANGKYYAGKTLQGKLRSYNSENPDYVPAAIRLMEEMKEIKPYKIIL